MSVPEASNYPASLDDDIPVQSAKKDLADKSLINRIVNSIIAIETEIGTDVAGNLTDLVTRLANMMNDNGALNQGSSFPGTTYPGMVFYRTDTDKFYIRNAADDTWIYIGGVPDFSAGTYVEASADTERTNANTSYVEVKKFTPMVRAGTVNIYFDHKVAAGTGSTQVLVNGVQEGATANTTSSTYVNTSISNITVEVGDVISLQIKTTSGGNSAAIRNVDICCANPTLPQEETGY
jgi:uncharacterized protein (UPF0333 family)